MRVAFCCLGDFEAPPGPRQTLLLARALQTAGHECLILVENDPDTIRTVAGGAGGVAIGRYRFVGPRLSRETRVRVAAFRPEIVHCYEPRTAPLAAALELSRAETIPLCVRFADDDEMLRQAAGGSGLRGTVGRPLLLAAGTVLPNRWPYKHPIHHRRMLRRAHGYDAITPALATEVSRRYGIRCEAILPAVPPSPADLPGVDGLRSKLGLRASGPLIVYTGSVFRAHYDDFRILLRAFAIVASRHHDASLVHTGRVADRYHMSELLALTGGGAGRTHFLGFLDDPADLHALQGEAAVLVQPGAPTEFNRLRLPAKVHDYLMVGRPVVTFEVGFGELLQDRRDAVLTRTDEPRELAEAIEWVLADQQRARMLGEAGRRRALRLFAPHEIAEQTVAYYKRAREMQAPR